LDGGKVHIPDKTITPRVAGIGNAIYTDINDGGAGLNMIWG
jgi:hypothetical protein